MLMRSLFDVCLPPSILLWSEEEGERERERERETINQSINDNSVCRYEAVRPLLCSCSTSSSSSSSFSLLHLSYSQWNVLCFSRLIQLVSIGAWNQWWRRGRRGELYWGSGFGSIWDLDSDSDSNSVSVSVLVLVLVFGSARVVLLLVMILVSLMIIMTIG
jgi:hypothetical protein